MPLMVVGMINIHALVSVFQLVRRASNLGIGVVRLSRVVASAALLATVVAAWPSRMACWWEVMVRGVWSRRELVRMAVQMVDVEW